MNTQSEIPVALRAAYMALHRQSDARFSALGVTADQFVLLATLAHGNALTQRELARRMPSDPSTVRAMLVLLEKRGLIQRETCPNDARARTVGITTAGKQMFRKLWTAGDGIRRQMYGSLSAEEAKLLVQLLTRVAESLGPQSVLAG